MIIKSSLKNTHTTKTNQKTQQNTKQTTTIWHVCLKLLLFFILEMLSMAISVLCVHKVLYRIATGTDGSDGGRRLEELCICCNNYLLYLNMDRIQQVESTTSCLSFPRTEIYDLKKDRPF